MENFNKNSGLIKNHDAIASHPCPLHVSIATDETSSDRDETVRLLSLSFNTRLSASDLNRLLKIVSANDIS
ncbi:MAG: hypothetical protein HQL76_11670 [Magnetococcales bacterium]|nr:hypothetical protein [Magnetococcales bacterium]